MFVGWKRTILVSVAEVGCWQRGLSLRNVTSGFIQGNIRSQHKERLQTYMFCATLKLDNDGISYRSGNVFRLLPCTYSSLSRGKYLDIFGNTDILLSLHLNIVMFGNPTRYSLGISEIILWPIANSFNVARLYISVIYAKKLCSRCMRIIPSSPLICSRGLFDILFLSKYIFFSRLQWLKLGKLLISLFVSIKTPNLKRPATASSGMIGKFWLGIETHDREGDEEDRSGNLSTVPNPNRSW